MNPKERYYFEKMVNYKPKGIKNINYIEIIDNIGYTSLQIRNISKEALSGSISPNNAKKEISDLLENIKQLKKEDKS